MIPTAATSKRQHPRIIFCRAPTGLFTDLSFSAKSIDGVSRKLLRSVCVECCRSWCEIIHHSIEQLDIGCRALQCNVVASNPVQIVNKDVRNYTAKQTFHLCKLCRCPISTWEKYRRPSTLSCRTIISGGTFKFTLNASL
jgi:hypothetical protein